MLISTPSSTPSRVHRVRTVNILWTSAGTGGTQAITVVLHAKVFNVNWSDSGVGGYIPAVVGWSCVSVLFKCCYYRYHTCPAHPPRPPTIPHSATYTLSGELQCPNLDVLQYKGHFA